MLTATSQGVLRNKCPIGCRKDANASDGDSKKWATIFNGDRYDCLRFDRLHTESANPYTLVKSRATVGLGSLGYEAEDCLEVVLEISRSRLGRYLIL